jgi:hypothetical protein
MQAFTPPRRRSRREAIAEALRLDETEDAAITELRALVAAVETRSDRLLTRYCGRPVRPFAHLARDARLHLAPPMHHLREW